MANKHNGQGHSINWVGQSVKANWPAVDWNNELSTRLPDSDTLAFQRRAWDPREVIIPLKTTRANGRTNSTLFVTGRITRREGKLVLKRDKEYWRPSIADITVMDWRRVRR